MSTKSERETERQLEEAYIIHKSYLKNDEDLKNYVPVVRHIVQTSMIMKCVEMKCVSNVS